MLEDLTSGTDQERQEFMAVCVDTLKRFRKNDMITPVYVFERLCNIIHPVSVLKLSLSLCNFLAPPSLPPSFHFHFLCN